MTHRRDQSNDRAVVCLRLGCGCRQTGRVNNPPGNKKSSSWNSPV